MAVSSRTISAVAELLAEEVRIVLVKTCENCMTGTVRRKVTWSWQLTL